MEDFGSWSKIVIVEDNTSLADIYKTRLEMIGYICFVAYDGEAALALIEKERPSLVLLDLMVPKVAGDQILERMRASEWGKDIKVLIISNLNEADAPAGLRSKGIEGYAVKANLSDDQLDQLVDRILKPAGQTEDVSLEAPDPGAVPPAPAAAAPQLAPLPVATPPEPVATVTNDPPLMPPETSAPNADTTTTPPLPPETPAGPAQYQ